MPRPKSKRKVPVTSKDGNERCQRQRRSLSADKVRVVDVVVTRSNTPTTDPHVAACKATLRQTRLLLQSYPEAALQQREDNLFPLHIACSERHGHNEANRLEIVKAWYDACPHAAVEPDNEGNTPFRKLLKRLLMKSEITSDEEERKSPSKSSDCSSWSNRADLNVLQFLFDKTATIPDNDKKFGRLPFHHFCQLVTTLTWKNSGKERRIVRSRSSNINLTVGPGQHQSSLWTNLMSIFRDMVEKYPHIALGYIDLKGYTPLMLLVKEVPQPFYDLQNKVAQHVRDWRRQREMLLQRRRRLLRLRNGEDDFEDGAAPVRNEAGNENRNRNEDGELEGNEHDDDEGDGGELAIMTQLANQISEDIESHQNKNLSYFANTLLLAIPMFRELWHSKEQEFAMAEFTNNDSTTDGDNTMDDGTTHQEGLDPEVEDDSSSSSEEEDNERSNHWKSGVKMPQQEAELLQMAYEGALNAALTAVEQEKQPADKMRSSQVATSLRSSSIMNLQQHGLTHDRSHLDRRILGAVVNTFQVRFLSLLGTAFHPHDFLKLLNHCISQHHFRPNRLNETDGTKCEQSVLHNFLASQLWKAQINLLQNGDGAEYNSDANVSSAVPKQLFSSIRVPSSLDMKRKDGPNGFNFILNQNHSNEENDEADLDTNGPQSGTSSESSSGIEQGGTYLPENTFFEMEKSILTAFETFLTLAPTVTQACGECRSSPLDLSLNIAQLTLGKNCSHAVQGKKGADNGRLKNEVTSVLSGNDFQFVFGNGDDLVACKTKEAYMVQRLAQQFPISCYHRCNENGQNGLLYPFMVPALASAERESSLPAGDSDKSSKGKKRSNRVVTQCTAPGSVKTDTLSTTYFLLKRYVAARDLSMLWKISLKEQRKNEGGT